MQEQLGGGDGGGRRGNELGEVEVRVGLQEWACNQEDAFTLCPKHGGVSPIRWALFYPGAATYLSCKSHVA